MANGSSMIGGPAGAVPAGSMPGQQMASMMPQQPPNPMMAPAQPTSADASKQFPIKHQVRRGKAAAMPPKKAASNKRKKKGRRPPPAHSLYGN